MPSTPADRGIAGPHWVRYGIAGDQKYLLGDFAETYDQLVVNANILADRSSSMSQFLAHTAKKPFVVDPQTHAFQHELDFLLSTSKKSAGELKRSWRALVDHYQEPLVSILGGDTPRTLVPDDFSDAQRLAGFVERVLRFQKDIVQRELTEGPDAHYLRYLAKVKKQDPTQVPPAMLVAPYFFIDGPLQNQWLEVTRCCLAAARRCVDANYPDLPLAAQVVVSKEFITDVNARTELATALRRERPDVFLLWIDDFSEQAASPYLLKAQIEFIIALAGDDIPVISLYGGFFSVAQMKVGRSLQGKLRGVCHGLEYGESRPVVPLGGGIPVARFYSRRLHHRMPARVAQKEVAAVNGFDSVAAFHEKVCGCPECLAVIKDDPNTDFRVNYTMAQEKFVNRQGRYVRMEFPTAEAADHCTCHYLWCKWDEYRTAWERDALRAGLTQEGRSLSKHLGAEYTAHAEVWDDLL